MNTLFQSRAEVLELIHRADDKNETTRLIIKFAELKKSRKPFYINIDDLDEILHWKLRRQYNRQSKFRERNTDANVRTITQAAFSIVHYDKDYETELRLKILITLSGVEVPVASAILTLCYPNQYSVIDYRNWRQFFVVEKEKTNYTTKEYIKYLTILKKLAKEYGVTPQEIDMAIWQYDIEMNNRRN